MMMSDESIFTRIPPQPTAKKPGQLNRAQVEQFLNQGWVRVDHFFNVAAELERVKNAIDQQVDALANLLFDAGKIQDKHENAPHSQRLTLIEKQFPGATILMHKNKESEYYRQLLANEKLVNVMEQLVGPNVAGHPVWNNRPKTPQLQNHDVPWHQDSAYLSSEADNALVVTAWIPLLDTNENNGCLQLIPNVHRQQKVGPHQGVWENTWYLYMTSEDCEKTFGVSTEKDSIICRVPYGGILLFNNLIPHRSLPNLSKDIRWSIDLRYLKTESPNGRSIPNIPLRYKDRPDFVQDWSDHRKLENQYIPKEDPFDTAFPIAGYIKRWPLVHENRHTDAWKREQEVRHGS